MKLRAAAQWTGGGVNYFAGWDFRLFFFWGFGPMSDADQTANGELDVGFAGDEAAPERLDSYGQRAWDELTPAMVTSGRLRETDRAALTRYCDMVGRYWKMAGKVSDEGETILTPTIALNAEGKPGKMWRRHPLLSEMRSLMAELRQLEDRFAMSPLARANLVNKQLGRGGSDASGLDFGRGGSDDADGEQDPANFH